MSKIIRLIDRTRTVQDWKCPRSRYWGYEWKGKGLVKKGTSLALFEGIVVHDAMAAIATFHRDNPNRVPIDDIADAASEEMKANLLDSGKGALEADVMDYANEQAALVEGLIRGFYKHMWPKLMAQYPKIVAIETEMEYLLDDGFVFMTKPDLIVEDSNGEYVYLEYKTTSSKKSSWIDSWDTAVQLHSSIKATEATLGKAPAYVQIVGLYKGYESYGKQSSPFCYAYKKTGNPPFTQDQIQYDYKAGFKRFPVWETPGGVKGWVASMPENVLSDQFPLTTPIFVDEDLVNKFFIQRLAREKVIASAMDVPFVDEGWSETLIDLDTVFPQHFDQCVPSYGWSCQYKKLCHGHVDDPLTEGYELRTPHHERELEVFNA